MISKSLFNLKTIERLTSNITINAKQRSTSNEWIQLLGEDKLKEEKANYFRFAQHILRDILGYNINDFNFEEGNMEFFFKNKIGKPLVCFEAKGTKCKDLWASQGRDSKIRETPVNQIWDYMSKHVIPYGVLTNYDKFILFDRSKSYDEFYEFNFSEIKTNPSKLKEFIAIFSKENIEKGFIENLKKESSQEERIFTREFYKLFHETRLMLIKEFEQTTTKDQAIHFAQLFINRLMFIYFAEDTDKLTPKLFENRILHTIKESEYIDENTSSVSNSIKSLFLSLDKGTPKIHGFNGGLFKEEIPANLNFKDYRSESYFKEFDQKTTLKEKDKILHEYPDLEDIIKIHQNKLNPLIMNMLYMAYHDFNSEVNVNILGHIFEQSLSDLETLQEGDTSKRKKEGIFYTPEYITDYICKNTIIPYISKTKDNIDIPTLINDYKDNISELEIKIKELRILDPACGSGAFLIKAVDVLLEIYKNIEEYKDNMGEYLATNMKAKGKKERKGEETKGQLKIIKFNAEEKAREIIDNCIYGVDLNEESVEITKLSLFLKIATKDKKLPTIDNKIKCGNSLIDDKEIAGDKTFNWQEQFPDIFKKGGFDIIIGNPPYVEARSLEQNVVDYLRKNYQTSGNRINTFASFIEKGINLLKENSNFGFIIHRNLIRSNDYDKTRKFILDNSKIKQILSFTQGVFEGVTGEMTVLLLNKNKSKIKDNIIQVYKYNIKIDSILKPEKIKQSIFEETAGNRFNIYLTTDVIKLLDQIKTDCVKLKDVAETLQGIIVGDEKKYISKLKENEKYKPILRGKDISRYGFPNNKEFIYYVSGTKVLTRGKTSDLFEKQEKILTQHVSGNITATIDTQQNYFLQTINSTTSTDKQIKNNYLLALLNSKLINFYYSNIFNLGAEFTTAVAIENLDELPIKQVSLEQQIPFIEKVGYILKLNKELYLKINHFLELLKSNYNIQKETNKLKNFYEFEFKDLLSELSKQKVDVKLASQSELLDLFNKFKQEIVNLKNQIDKTDNEIDQLVYKLYELTPEEIKLVEGNKYIESN